MTATSWNLSNLPRQRLPGLEAPCYPATQVQYRGGSASAKRTLYADHVSIIKFIERNWALPTITHRSRDNFPNPITEWGNPYVPVNSPALSDLFDFFDIDDHFDGWGWDRR
jgi:hypothetical protein